MSCWIWLELYGTPIEIFWFSHVLNYGSLTCSAQVFLGKDFVVQCLPAVYSFKKALLWIFLASTGSPPTPKVRQWAMTRGSGMLKNTALYSNPSMCPQFCRSSANNNSVRVSLFQAGGEERGQTSSKACCTRTRAYWSTSSHESVGPSSRTDPLGCQIQGHPGNVWKGTNSEASGQAVQDSCEPLQEVLLEDLWYHEK